MYLDRLMTYVDKQAGVEFDEVMTLYSNLYGEYHRLAQDMIAEILDYAVVGTSLSSIYVDRVLNYHADIVDSTMIVRGATHIVDTCNRITLSTKNTTKSNHTKTVTKFKFSLFSPNFVTQEELVSMVLAHFRRRALYVSTIIKNKIHTYCDVNLSAQQIDVLSTLLYGKNYFKQVAHMCVIDLNLFRSVYQLAEMGFDRYRLTAVFDNATSGICSKLNGATFSVESAIERLRSKLYMSFEDMLVSFKFPLLSELEFWISNNNTYDDSPFSLPPFHPFCRTIIEPYEF